MRNPEALDEYLMEILKTDLIKDVNLLFDEKSKPDIKNKKKLIIYVDEDLDNYIEQLRTKTETNISKYEENIKEKEDKLWLLKRKYKNTKSEEEITKLEESILIEEIDIDHLKRNVPNLKVQDIMHYAINNHKVPVLKFEYCGEKFTMQQFAIEKSTIKILKSVI